MSVLLYSQGSAGPCGVEASVAAAGIWLAVLGQVAITVFFSLPQAIISVDLARAETQNGGYALWAARWLGDAWGSAAGAWGVVATCAYNASLVDNIVQYLAVGGARLPGRWADWLVLLGVAAVSVAVCASPLRKAGALYMAIIAFTLALFAALIICSATRFEWVALPVVPRDINRQHLGSLVTLLLYSAVYFDSATSYLGVTRNPEFTIPAAIAAVAFLEVGMNVLTLVVTFFGSGAPAADWTGGYFAVVAARVSGLPLQRAVIVNAFVTNFQIVCAGMLTGAFILSGMADRGLAPRRLASVTASAALCAVLTVAFGALSFGTALAVQTVAYGGVVLVECAAYCAKMGRARATRAVAVTALPAAFTVLSICTLDVVIVGATAGAMAAVLALAAERRPSRATAADVVSAAVVIKKREPDGFDKLVL